MHQLSGLWLRLITPFRDDRLDEISLLRMIRHYTAEPIDGLILAATTGEGMTLEETEIARLVYHAATCLETTGRRRIPICLGLSGSFTNKMVKALQITTSWPIAFYLIACPYYTRPSQDGLYPQPSHHFSLCFFNALNGAPAKS
jgi:4-hydroxy-tetrahydrodipicolinate synthase